jgi:formate hydrogenlyase subunit 4
MEKLIEILTSKHVMTASAAILAPVAGALIMGIDRKLTARMQGRLGPPLLQPFYDLFKLFGKEPIALHRPQIMYAVLHLVFMILVLILLMAGQDLLMILLVHAFSSICLILGAMSVRSPYSWLGSQRKILQILAYEPILLVLILAINLRDNSFLASKVMENTQPLLISMPLLFLAFVCVLAIELSKSPFDVATSHHAHQEIVKGLTLEYSGPFLGILEIAHFYEIAIFFGLIMCFWHTNIWIALLLESAVFVFLLVVDNAFSRLSAGWMVRYMWTVPLTLALANLIWLWS